MPFVYILKIVMIMILSAGSAQATTFVYNDPEHGYQVSFPDNWRQGSLNGSQKFRIRPLHHQDKAECFMNVKRDGRLTIYPEKQLRSAIPILLDDSFWKTEVLPDHRHAQVLKYHAPAGLGPAFATSLQWTWGSILVGEQMNVTDVNPIGLSEMPNVGEIMADENSPQVTHDASNVMRAMSIATIYGDQRYRFTCQSQASAFEAWQPLFAEIFASIKFDNKYVAYPTGYYRDFLSDKPLLRETY